MDCNEVEGRIALEYHGTSNDLSEMNSYEVASYIIAFSDFAGVVSRNAYGEKIKLETKIQGFRGESFDIDFVLQVSGIAFGLFSSVAPMSIAEFINLTREAISAWIHLRGKPPKEIKPIPSNINSFEVENQHGQIIYINGPVLNIVTNQKAGEAAQQFLGKPLEAGISSVHIKSPSAKEDPIIVEQEDAPSFVPITIEKDVSENDVVMGLLIESPTFKEGNKWRFNDGQSSFYADITDEAFLKKVDSGEERFGKGDLLRVEVRFRQTSNNGSLKMERTIIKVLEHEIAREQGLLFS